MFKVIRRDTRPSVDVPFYQPAIPEVTAIFIGEGIVRSVIPDDDDLGRTVTFRMETEQNWENFLRHPTVVERYTTPMWEYNRQKGILYKIMSKGIEEEDPVTPAA